MTSVQFDQRAQQRPGKVTELKCRETTPKNQRRPIQEGEKQETNNQDIGGGGMGFVIPKPNWVELERNGDDPHPNRRACPAARRPSSPSSPRCSSAMPGSDSA